MGVRAHGGHVNETADPSGGTGHSDAFGPLGVDAGERLTPGLGQGAHQIDHSVSAVYRSGNTVVVAHIGLDQFDLAHGPHGLQKQSSFGIAHGNAHRATLGRQAFDQVPAQKSRTTKNRHQTLGHTCSACANEIACRTILAPSGFRAPFCTANFDTA